MSLHKSLKGDKYKEFRSVRTRRERVEKLIRNLKWLEGRSVYGLPKEIIRRLKYKIKQEKVEKKVEPIYTPPTEEKTKKKSRDDTETRRK